MCIMTTQGGVFAAEAIRAARLPSPLLVYGKNELCIPTVVSLSVSASACCVRERVLSFAFAQCRIAPGALRSIVLTGSAVAGDWIPGRSDIDVVFVLDRHLSSQELARVAELHAATIPQGPIDGLYLTGRELRMGPTGLRVAPQVVNGVLAARQRGGQLTWVTWREIEEGVEARIDLDGRVGAWTPSRRRFPGADAGARAHSRSNLHHYWTPLAANTRNRLATQRDAQSVNAAAVQWIVLGPGRLVTSR